jgi:peptidoglycan hydrolase-like protein with peptidoglycan-binding domain
VTQGEDRLRRARRGWLVFSGCALAAVLLVAVTATAVGRHLRSPAQLAADAEPPAPSVVTATVERRVLAEPVVLRGRVQPGASVRLYPPAPAVGPNSVVTKVLAQRGERVREGQVVLERSGEPLFVLVSPFPLYRDLTAGLTGPDVEQVQRALKRLGYDVATTGSFDTRTRDAVAELYTDRGYTAPTASAPPSPGVAGAAVSLPQAHVVVLGRTGQRVSAVGVRVGDVLADPRKALFELDRGAPSLVAVVSAEQAALLAVGQAATASDDGAGTTTGVAVSAIGDQPVESDGRTGYEVRFRFTGKALSGTAQRSVRVDVDVAGGAEPVLAVPVTAVFSRADGTTFVTVVSGQGTVDVPVRAGRIAGGWVEVAGADDRLAEGAAVAVGEGTPARR